MLSDYPEHWCVVGRVLNETDLLVESDIQWEFRRVGDIPRLAAEDEHPLHVSWHLWDSPSRPALGTVEGVLDFDWEGDLPEPRQVEYLIRRLSAVPDLLPVIPTAYFLLTMCKGFHVRYDLSAHGECNPWRFGKRVLGALDPDELAGANLDPPHWFRRVPGSIRARGEGAQSELLRTRVVPAAQLSEGELRAALSEWIA